MRLMDIVKSDILVLERMVEVLKTNDTLGHWNGYYQAVEAHLVEVDRRLDQCLSLLREINDTNERSRKSKPTH